MLEDKGVLWNYISKNSKDNNYDNVLLIAIPISIIASIYVIKNVGKSEKICEEKGYLKIRGK